MAGLEADAVAAGLFGDKDDAGGIPGGSGEVELDPNDPRLMMRLPTPPPTVEEFYADLGCPFEDSKTGEHIINLAPYQLRTLENLRRHRKLLVLKSQKIGLSSLGIVATLHEGLTRCQGYEMIILAQSKDKVVEHGRDMVKFIENSKYSDYLIAKQHQVPGAIKSEVTSSFHIYLQNRDLTSVRPTHIYLLPPSSRQIASIKRAKFVWASDITIVEDVAEHQQSTFMALLSRLIMTEGNIFIECPTVGNLGPIYTLDRKFQNAVKAGILDEKTGKVLRPQDMPPAVAEHTFFVDRIPVREAVECGVMRKNAVEALRIEHGPMFPAYFEANWFAGDSAWFGPEQLAIGTKEAARLAEDIDRRPAPIPQYPPPRGLRGLPDLGEIQIPDPERFADVVWFHGLDPAARKNNFGIVVYGLFPKPDPPPAYNTPGANATQAVKRHWAPFLRDCFDIQHGDMTETISWVQNVLFRVYPPRLAIIDATRDTPIAEELARKYGETRCIPLIVTNQTNYNMFLNAYKVFSEKGPGAHEWPLIGALRDERKRAVFSTYKDQLAHERATYTAEGRVRFEKPPDMNNDVSRAGLMALEAVRMFQRGRIGNPEDIMVPGSGRADASLVNQADIAEMVAADAEAEAQRRFDAAEEARYGSRDAMAEAEAEGGAFALPY